MKIDPILKEDLKQYVLQKMKQKDVNPLVLIETPYQLSEEELNTLKKKISMLQHAEIKQEINRDLMAGIIIKFGSKVIDLSLKSELQMLEQMLYESA